MEVEQLWICYVLCRQIDSIEGFPVELQAAK
jgi:hypothetical protein